LIGGFVIRGSQPVSVIVRAQGPSLANYGLTGVLADTVLEVYQGSTLVQSNDDWKATQQTAIQATGMAPAMDAESAMVLTLQPGVYSTIVRGKSGATGVAIVEAFLTQ
jgi:hypothetical protein